MRAQCDLTENSRVEHAELCPPSGQRGSAFGHCRDGHIAGPYCNHSRTAALSYSGISRGLGAEFFGARKGVGPHLSRLILF
jgi:hypothetical protein